MFKLILVSTFAVYVISVSHCSSDSQPYGETRADFEQFVQQYNKEYDSEADKEAHYQTFVDNVRFINSENAKGGSATFGVNQFTDLTQKEMGCFRGFGRQCK